MDIIINGLKLDLKELAGPSIPYQTKKMKLFQKKLKYYLKISIIVYSTPEDGEFISGIFTRDKKDGNKSMIVSLKKNLCLSAISTLRWNPSIMSLASLNQMYMWHLLT